jgi:hypothetical protein
VPVETADGEKPAGRWDARVTVATGVLGVLATIAALTTRQLLFVLLLAGAALPWVPLMTRAARGRWRLATAAVASLALVGAAVAVRLSQEQPAAPPSATPAPRFVPPDGPVGHCLTISGTGLIPAGKALVLLDRATDQAGFYTPGSRFNYDGAALPSGDGWIARDLDIGAGDPSDNGQHIALVALLTRADLPERLAALAEDGSGALPGDPLAQGRQTDRVVLVRNADNTRCPRT